MGDQILYYVRKLTDAGYEVCFGKEKLFYTIGIKNQEFGIDEFVYATNMEEDAEEALKKAVDMFVDDDYLSPFFRELRLCNANILFGKMVKAAASNPEMLRLDQYFDVLKNKELKKSEYVTAREKLKISELQVKYILGGTVNE